MRRPSLLSSPSSSKSSHHVISSPQLTSSTTSITPMKLSPSLSKVSTATTTTKTQTPTHSAMENPRSLTIATQHNHQQCPSPTTLSRRRYTSESLSHSRKISSPSAGFSMHKSHFTVSPQVPSKPIYSETPITKVSFRFDSSKFSSSPGHSPFTLAALKNNPQSPFLERIHLAIVYNINEYPLLTSPELKNRIENDIITEGDSNIDSIAKVEYSMELILLFFNTSKITLQELYKCNNIETIFGKRMHVITTHQLIESCNNEMEKYMSTLETAKNNPEFYLADSNEVYDKQHCNLHNELVDILRNAQNNSWSLASPSNRLVAVADQIGRAIPQMRELYILSENILKRLDLAAEWYDLYNIIIKDLEIETESLVNDLVTVKDQVISSGLNSFLISNSEVKVKALGSTKYDLTELEFLSQALSDSPAHGCRTLPYLNGSQKIVISK